MEYGYNDESGNAVDYFSDLIGSITSFPLTAGVWPNCCSPSAAEFAGAGDDEYVSS
jgi:hypothetical protein